MRGFRITAFMPREIELLQELHGTSHPVERRSDKFALHILPPT